MSDACLSGSALGAGAQCNHKFKSLIVNEKKSACRMKIMNILTSVIVTFLLFVIIGEILGALSIPIRNGSNTVMQSDLVKMFMEFSDNQQASLYPLKKSVS